MARTKSGLYRGTDRLNLGGFAGLWDEASPVGPLPRLPSIVVAGRTLTPTPVFATYWRFAAARQKLYLSRLAGNPAPWTDDPILREYRFTNVFRASDRVSQYLIRHVLYGNDAPTDVENVVFRVLLFKLFNKISTWELLESELGEIKWAAFEFERYRSVLERAAEEGPVYSAAYVMPPPRLGEPRKYANHLRLLENMMGSPLTAVIESARRLQEVFATLKTFPAMGRFLAFQFTIDLNYSPVLDISEDDFVVAGPGACDGIRKCFGQEANGVEADVIRYAVDHQEVYFTRLGLQFGGLFGRRLHLVDCQNLFCEVDKYARVAHPSALGISGRTRIKQKFHANAPPIRPMFPPRWGLNDLCSRSSRPS